MPYAYDLAKHLQFAIHILYNLAATHSISVLPAGYKRGPGRWIRNANFFQSQ